MEEIEELVQQANELFETAEEQIEIFPDGSKAKFREGIDKLLRAFLILNDLDPEGVLDQMIEACKQIEPSLEAIEDELRLFSGETEAVDAEELVDAANEVWDFMIDLLSEEEV